MASFVAGVVKIIMLASVVATAFVIAIDKATGSYRACGRGYPCYFAWLTGSAGGVRATQCEDVGGREEQIEREQKHFRGFVCACAWGLN